MKLVAVSAALIAATAFVQGACAKEVAIGGHSHSQVKGMCGGKGDVYWTEGSTGSTYGCFKSDGSGIVCSGVTSQQKKTCSTFMQGNVERPHFPSRDDLRAAERSPE